MKHYDTVVLGASFYALGYAATHENTLILEESEVVGSDYCGILRPVQSILPESVCEKSEKLSLLYNFLKTNGIISKEKIDILRLSAAINKFVCDNGIRVLLNSRIIDVKTTNDGYVVRCYTNSGIREYSCSSLIDTTQRRISDRNAAAVTEKYLNLSVFMPCQNFKDLLKEHYNKVSFYEGFSKDEWLVRFEFSSTVPLYFARKELENAWMAAFDGKNTLIDIISFDFDFKSAEKGVGICKWINPYNFNCPLSAFSDGCDEGGAENAVL